MITVRDAAGREIILPHYEVLAGHEYRGGAIDRDNEARMARNREILRRNGRRVNGEQAA